MEIYTVSRDPVWLQRPLKERERNLVAAMLGIVVVAVLATALAQPRWFYLRGGGCSQSYLGMQQFFADGEFKEVPVVKSPSPTSVIYYTGGNYALRDCVTPKIVAMLRFNIAVVILAILLTLIQLGFDTFGPNNSKAKIFRRNALGSISTVILCVFSIGICYYCTMLIEEQQEKSKMNPGTKVSVKFDISYYLVTGAGAIAVLATAANLLRHHSLHASTQAYADQMEDHLLEDYEGAETFSIGNTYCRLWPCRSGTQRTHPTSTPVTAGGQTFAPPPYSP